MGRLGSGNLLSVKLVSETCSYSLWKRGRMGKECAGWEGGLTAVKLFIRRPIADMLGDVWASARLNWWPS